MTSTSTRRSLVTPILALLVLYAVAHNWGGVTDAYFAMWQWAAAQLTEALQAAVTSETRAA